MNSSPKHHIKSAQVHKRVSRSGTLMRSGVKKPATQIQSGLHKISASNPYREFRAKTTPKHKQVEHFGNPVKSTAGSVQSHAKEVVSGEIVQRSEPQAKPAAAAPLPSMVTSVSHQKLERLLDEALTKADSHKQAMRYHAARHFWQKRWFSGPVRWAVILVVLAGVIVGGLMAWQKMPALSIKAAGIRAHMSPTVPAYKPDGYAFASPASASSGAVTIKYKSTSDSSQTYEITQTPSNVTSNAVGQNVVPKGASVQTSDVQGNTVYIYGSGNNAAWVNNGVLYTINDKANLTSDQLIKIVQGINP